MLNVRLTPGASVDDLPGIESGADGRSYLKARVRSVAEKGKANMALITLLSKRTGLAKSSIHIRSGGKSRLKTVFLACAAGRMKDILARLENRS
ncbi:DUF167 family protein [Hoeflea prorocentri]|uniref:DUF167 family protein n=1 Tax=Hoeflea prorocentri TaxID=1922333 RepID=UPI002FDE7E80